MSTGYQVIGPYVNGEVISATLFNSDFGAIAAAMHQTTGHDHDGTIGGGAPIAKIGDADYNNKIEIDSTNNLIKLFIEVGGSTSTEILNISADALTPIASGVGLGTVANPFDTANITTVTSGTVNASTEILVGHTTNSTIETDSGTSLTPSGVAYFTKDDTDNSAAVVVTRVDALNGVDDWIEFQRYDSGTSSHQTIGKIQQYSNTGLSVASPNSLLLKSGLTSNLFLTSRDKQLEFSGAAFSPSSADNGAINLGTSLQTFSEGFFSGNLNLQDDTTSASTQKIIFSNATLRHGEIRANYSSDVDGNGTGLTVATNPNNAAVLDRLEIDKDGDITFYEDDGTTSGVFWDASEGRLGIGTSSPAGNLHISAGDSGDATLILEADTDNLGSETDNPKLQLRQDGNLVRSEVYMEGTSGDTTNSSVANALVLEAKDSNGANYIQFATGGTTGETPTLGHVRMTIKHNGKVGIGTNNPDADLHVNNTAGSELRIDTTGGSNVDSVLNFRENGVDRASLYWDGADNDLYLETTVGDIALLPAGNVGIGNSSPDHKLHVHGGDIMISSDSDTSTGDGKPALLFSEEHPDNTDSNDAMAGIIYDGDIQSGDANYLGLGVWENAAADQDTLAEQKLTTTLNITRDNKVGIGTKTPAAKLHVYDVEDDNENDYPHPLAKFETSGSQARITLRNAESSSVTFSGLSLKVDGYTASIENNLAGGLNYPATQINTMGDFPGIHVQSYVHIDGTSAYLLDDVGIGTDSPDSRFHVYGGDIRITSDEDTNSSYGHDGKPSLIFNEFANNHSQYEEDVAHAIITYNGGGEIGEANYLGFGVFNQFLNAEDTLAEQKLLTDLNITRDGKVGIGTTKPTKTLDVLGTIKVTTSSDSVSAIFADDVSVGKRAPTTDELLVATRDVEELANWSLYISNNDYANVDARYRDALDANGDGNYSSADVSGILNFIGDNYTSADVDTFNDILDGTIPDNDTFVSELLNGDFDVDTNTLYVDSVNQKVGIGTSTPSEALDVIGTVAADTVETQDIIVYESQAAAVSPLLTTDRTAEELADLFNATFNYGVGLGPLVGIPDYQERLINFSISGASENAITVADPTAIGTFINDSNNNYTSTEQSDFSSYTTASPYVYQSTIIDDIKRGDYDYLIAPAKVGINTETPASALDVIGDISVSGNITSDLGLNLTPTQGIEMRAGDADGIEMHWWAQSSGTTVAADGEQTKRFHITDRGVHVGDDVTGTYTAGDNQTNQDIDFGFLVGRNSHNYGSNNVGLGYDLSFPTNSASNFAQGSIIDFFGATQNCAAFGGNLDVGTVTNTLGLEHSFIGGHIAKTNANETFTWATGAVGDGGLHYSARNNGRGSVLFGKQGQIDSNSVYSLLGGRVGAAPEYIEPSLIDSSYAFSWGLGNVVDDSNASVVCGKYHSVDGAANALVAGENHEVLGSNAFVAGTGNETTAVDAATAIGKDNKAEGNYSVAIGKDNNTLGEAGVCLGQGLKTPLFLNSGNYEWDNYTTVVGGYNNASYKYNTDHSGSGATWVDDQRFVVGTGTNAFSTDNGFIVAVPDAGNGSTTGFCGILMPHLEESPSYSSTTAAKNGGVPIGGLYRDGNTVKILLSTD